MACRASPGQGRTRRVPGAWTPRRVGRAPASSRRHPQGWLSGEKTGEKVNVQGILSPAAKPLRLSRAERPTDQKDENPNPESWLRVVRSHEETRGGNVGSAGTKPPAVVLSAADLAERSNRCGCGAAAARRGCVGARVRCAKDDARQTYRDAATTGENGGNVPCKISVNRHGTAPVRPCGGMHGRPGARGGRIWSLRARGSMSGATGADAAPTAGWAWFGSSRRRGCRLLAQKENLSEKIIQKTEKIIDNVLTYSPV